MTWNSTWPVGGVSVRANRVTGQENTTYIEQTMIIDHYWDESGTFDGRHRHVSMQTASVDEPLPALVGGILYYRTVSATNARVEMFYRNINKIYQVSPSFLEGTVVIPAGYATIASVPANSYGDIFMWTNALGRFSGQTGFFRSDATTVESWSILFRAQGDSTDRSALKMGNGSEASGFNIRARADDASAGLTWNYRITYRGI